MLHLDDIAVHQPGRDFEVIHSVKKVKIEVTMKYDVFLLVAGWWFSVGEL